MCLYEVSLCVICRFVEGPAYQVVCSWLFILAYLLTSVCVFV